MTHTDNQTILSQSEKVQIEYNIPAQFVIIKHPERSYSEVIFASMGLFLRRRKNSFAQLATSEPAVKINCVDIKKDMNNESTHACHAIIAQRKKKLCVDICYVTLPIPPHLSRYQISFIFGNIELQ